MKEPIVRLKIKYQDVEREISGVGEEEGFSLVIRRDDKVSGRFALDSVEYWSNHEKTE